ncbi:hypothetical protein EV1_046271 [Malus domestica]
MTVDRKVFEDRVRMQEKKWVSAFHLLGDQIRQMKVDLELKEMEGSVEVAKLGWALKTGGDEDRVHNTAGGKKVELRLISPNGSDDSSLFSAGAAEVTSYFVLSSSSDIFVPSSSTAVSSLSSSSVATNRLDVTSFNHQLLLKTV